LDTPEAPTFREKFGAVAASTGFTFDTAVTPIPQ
jgi:hypothetical protein